jgi:general secretion pathway protein F
VKVSVIDYKLKDKNTFPASNVSDKGHKENLPHYEERDSYGTDNNREAFSRDIFRRTRTKDICRIARQLATLLRAGMPLVPALSALVEQLQGSAERKLMFFGRQENPLADVMKEVCVNVNTGSSLSAALGRHPDVFSNVFVNMVAAGESSGTLEDVFLSLAEMLEKRVHLTNKVKSAVAYPIMMTVVAVTVVVFLLSFVVPSIT